MLLYVLYLAILTLTLTLTLTINLTLNLTSTVTLTHSVTENEYNIDNIGLQKGHGNPSILKSTLYKIKYKIISNKQI